jgi:small subunit ribosomal protein S2
VFVLDTKKEHIAVTEANKLGIPVVAVVDTNVDPDVIQYPIPGNDDALRSIRLFASKMADAVIAGRSLREAKSAEMAATARARSAATASAAAAAAAANAATAAAAAAAATEATV